MSRSGLGRAIVARDCSVSTDLYPWSYLSACGSAVSSWRFYPRDELNADPSNWFGPNVQAVLEAFDSAGFRTLLLEKWDDRAAFCAETAMPLRHSLRESYEAWEGNQV